MNIRDLQLAQPPKPNTPCKHTPLKQAHCYACPTKQQSTNQRVRALRARKNR